MTKKCISLCLSAFVPLCLICFSSAAFAGIGNPTTPVSARPSLSPTTPMSSYSSGFIPAPTPSITANQIMTGNSPGLSYFHGSLPYTSQNYFMGSLPSTSLDSFRRYTAPQNQPFYSPTAASPDFLAAQAAQSSRIRLNVPTGQIPYSLLSPTTPPSQAAFVQLFPSTYDLYNRSLIGSISGYKNPDLFINLSSSERLTRPAVPEQPVLPLPELEKLPLPAKNTETIQTEKPVTGTDEIKQQIEQLSKLLEQPSTIQQANQKLRESIEQSWQEKLKNIESQTASLAEKLNKATTPPAQSSAPVKSGASSTPPFNVEVQKVLEEKANEQFALAYKLLKEQKFYPAADAFTNASLYQPRNPVPYVAKAIALFAAGDYMFASQTLSLTLQLSPDYAKTNLDIASLIGSKDKLDERIADLQKFAAQNNSGRLYFLLAYIQFKTSQLPQAKASIDQALKLIPDEPSFLSLKSALDAPPSK